MLRQHLISRDSLTLHNPLKIPSHRSDTLMSGGVVLAGDTYSSGPEGSPPGPLRLICSFSQ
jgi:hypothetical protein